MAYSATLHTGRLNKVLEDWEQVRAIPDWQQVAGKVLFQNLFDKCPDAKPLFGFSMKVNPRNDNILKSSRFSKHSKFLIKMVDKTVSMLLSESETSDGEEGRTSILTHQLIKLGKKHVAYGVQPEWFPYMTESLICMLEEVIGTAHREAWEDVFGFLCYHMDYGHKLIDKDNAASKDKAICMAVWEKFQQIDNYKKQGGLVLFQTLFELCPEVKPLFGFPLDANPQSDELLKSSRFAFHSQFLVEMIEKTMSLLGDDNETMTKNLSELGKKHVSFGVTAEMFPYMTDSVIAMLKKLLGEDQFTPNDQDSFSNVMSLMIADLVKGQRMVEKTLADNNKDIVIGSWEKFTQIPDYETKGGLYLFQTLFEKCPEAKLLFGFPQDTDPKSDKLLKNDLFKKHATFLLNMIGKTVSMLGYAADDQTLEEQLIEIGKKHVTYGVKAKYFPLMTESVIKTMKHMLGTDFTAEEEKAWDDILSLLITDMVKGQRILDIGLAAANTNVTKRNWQALKAIHDYDEVGGQEIFVNLFRICPEAKPFFGFNEAFPEKEIRYSKRILVHGSFIVEMVERALDWIGEDDFELEKMLHELGTKHSKYGVNPDHMPYMQQSIIVMLKVLLKEDQFSRDDEKAWNSVLSALVANITQAQRAIAMKKLSEELEL